MNLPVHLDSGPFSARERWLVIGWSLIGLKCSLIWWAMARWNVPFHPLWIVGPTVLFAALATTLWLTHHGD